MPGAGPLAGMTPKLTRTPSRPGHGDAERELEAGAGQRGPAAVRVDPDDRSRRRQARARGRRVEDAGRVDLHDQQPTGLVERDVPDHGEAAGVDRGRPTWAMRYTLTSPTSLPVPGPPTPPSSPT